MFSIPRSMYVWKAYGTEHLISDNAVTFFLAYSEEKNLDLSNFGSWHFQPNFIYEYSRKMFYLIIM
jgi:hypothetical protein